MFNDIDKDVTIIYPGGSGGFLIYFLFLLTGRFISGDPIIFESDADLKKVLTRIYQQFPYSLSSNSKLWKEKEFWPNNFFIKNQNIKKRKLFLICNPLFDKTQFKHNILVSKNTFVVFLYTNINLHVRMAYDKQAYWFTEVSKKSFNAPSSNFQYIRKIISNVETFQNKKVCEDVSKIIKIWNPNVIIDLNDICKLELDSNQQEFLKYWYNLQTKKAKKLMKWNI